MIRPAIRVPLTAVLVAFLLHATPAFAQILPVPEQPAPDEDDMDEAAAYVALSTTPVGGLAPMAEIPGLAGTAGRMQFHGQFGLVEQDGPFSTRNFAFGVGLPRQRMVVRLTGGIVDFVCDDEGLFQPGDGFELDCGMGFFGGADVTYPLVRPVLPGSSGSSFTANFVVSLGLSSSEITEISFEDPFDPFMNGEIDISATTFSVAVGVPLAFVVQSEDITVIPHLTPRIGYGRARTTVGLEFQGERDRESLTNSDFLPMIGAGVDINFGASGFGLGLGVQKIFAEDSEMLVGINLSLRRR